MLPSPTNSFVIDPHPNWAPAPSEAAWIANTSTAGSYNRPAGMYEYSRNFYISDPNNTSLDLYFMADDSGRVYLNGHEVLSIADPGYSTPAHSIVTNPNLFQQGNNQIKVRVSNSVANPHGFVLSAILESCGNVGGLVGSDPEIASSSHKEAIALFPNPTNGYLEISGLPGHVELRYQITDTWGRTLLEGKDATIDVHAFPAGIYCLKLVTKQGTQLVRFVKQ